MYDSLFRKNTPVILSAENGCKCYWKEKPEFQSPLIESYNYNWSEDKKDEQKLAEDLAKYFTKRVLACNREELVWQIVGYKAREMCDIRSKSDRLYAFVDCARALDFTEYMARNGYITTDYVYFSEKVLNEINYHIMMNCSIFLQHFICERFLYEISRDCYTYINAPNVIETTLALFLYEDIKTDINTYFDHDFMIYVVEDNDLFDRTISMFIDRYVTHNTLRKYVRRSIAGYDADRYYSRRNLKLGESC